ncbi:cation:proton antiporter [Lichenicoccus sp.]|uniref:cation:proton antiporter domain-containing protein n=1 Tax=Lichenicoccus sp. TaxID=2781899 RepID=UPI003D11777A
MLLVSVLLQLIVMIGAARFCNRIARRLGQPGVIGEIVAGLLLGPSLFGWLCPHLSAAPFAPFAAAPITMISQVGLILPMFQIGSGSEFSRLDVGRDLGVLPPKMFTMLVLMAVVTTLMTGPLLRLLLPRIGHSAPRLAEA